jgi:hypothetical protein
MTQFEVVTITLGFVLGLSMSHILWSAASAVRARHELDLDWVPFVWAGCVFLMHVGYWPFVYTVDLVIDQWTWWWYLHVLFLAVLLFASGALVLPSEEKQRLGSLANDFDEHGRLGLIPLALYCWLNVPTSVWLGNTVFVTGNYAIFGLGAVALIAFSSKRRVVQRVAALLFAVVEIWAMVFLWSRAGMGV